MGGWVGGWMGGWVGGRMDLKFAWFEMEFLKTVLAYQVWVLHGRDVGGSE